MLKMLRQVIILNIYKIKPDALYLQKLHNQ